MLAPIDKQDEISLEGLAPVPGTVDRETETSLLGLEPARKPAVTPGRVFGRFWFGIRQAPALAAKGQRIALEIFEPEYLRPVKRKRPPGMEPVPGAEPSAIDDIVQSLTGAELDTVLADTQYRMDMDGLDERSAYVEAVIDFARRRNEHYIGVYEAIERATDLPLKYQGVSSGFLEDVAGGLATTAISLPFYWANPALGMGVTFSQIQGMKIAELERSGVTDPETLLKSSIFSATTQTPLEAISSLFILSRILKPKGTWTQALTRIVQGFGGEALTEFVQQYPDEWATIMALNPDIGAAGWAKVFLANIGKTTEEAFYAAAVGGVVGGGTVAVGTATKQALNTLVSPEQKAINRVKSGKGRREALAARERAVKVIGAGLLQQERDIAEDAVRITPEVIQEYIENPKRSPITDKDLDAILGDEDPEIIISDILNRLGIKDVIEEEVPAAIGARPLFEPVTSQEFIKSLGKTTRPEYLTVYTPEELDTFELRKLGEHDAGYALKPDGDIVNVYNNSGIKGLGSLAIMDAVIKGGTKLDAYDGHLIQLYGSLGFKETERFSWDPQYKPEGWTGGTPDVVYMEVESGIYNPVDIAGSYEAQWNRRLVSDAVTRDLFAQIHQDFTQKTSLEMVPGEPTAAEVGAEGRLPGTVKPTPASLAARAPTWYSQMVEVLTEKLPGKGTGSSYTQTIESWVKKGLVKEEEVAWSGIRDWLQEQNKIDKQNVLAYLAANHIQLEEVVKGGPVVQETGINPDDIPLKEPDFDPAQIMYATRVNVGPKVFYIVELENEEYSFRLLDFEGWQINGYYEYKQAIDDAEIQASEAGDVSRLDWEEIEDELEEFWGADAVRAWEGSAPETLEEDASWEAQYIVVEEHSPDGTVSFVVRRADDSNRVSAHNTLETAQTVADGYYATYAGEWPVDLSDPKFPSYVLPGGKDYRELLLILPVGVQGVGDFYIVWNSGRASDLTFDTRIEAQKYLDKMSDSMGPGQIDQTYVEKPDFRGGHYDEPNVLVHVRFNERTDAEGNRVLFIEEIQSDWHQTGRKRGYITHPSGYDIRKLPENHPAAEEGMVYGLYDEGSLLYTAKTEVEIVAHARDRGGPIREEAPKGVPEAPFRKTWPLLALKRMVRWAAENGFDTVAWTPGEVQAERGDLTKQVDEINWARRTDGTHDITVIIKETDETIIRDAQTDDQLEELIGKEPAKKIIEGELTRDVSVKGYVGAGTLEGKDLKIGGEPMAAFYDKMLISMVNRFFNRTAWGKAKVETTTIPATEYWEPGDKEFPMKDVKTVEAWSLPITEEMKEKAISEGMPMFQIGPSAQDLPVFDPRQVESVPLREAIQSGLVSEDEGAVIDGVLQVFPQAWREHFAAAFSSQQFAPTGAQLRMHGVPLEEQQRQVVQGALIFENVGDLKEDARRVAVMFGGNKIETFLHEFGEFANAHLLTPNDRVLVRREYEQAKTKATENEWFSDGFRDWWLRQIDGKDQVVSNDLQTLFEKVLQAIREVWARIRGLRDQGFPLDTLFNDIINKGRIINRAAFGEAAAIEERPKTAIRRTTGQALTEEERAERDALRGQLEAEARAADIAFKAGMEEGAKPTPSAPETVKGKVRRVTGQARTATERLERDNLKAAIQMAARNAKIAMREGNKEGVEKGKAEIRALFARAKERQGLREEAAKVRARIRKLLKGTVPKKKEGKPRGKYGARVQEDLDTLRRAARMKPLEAAAKLEENLITYQNQIPPYEIALENGVLSMSATNLISLPDQAVELWTKLHGDIAGYMASAVAERDRTTTNRQAQMEYYRESVIGIMGGIPEDIDTVGEPAVTDKSIRARVRNAIFAGMTNRLQGWKDVLDTLAFKDKRSRPGQSIISQFGDVLEQKNAEKKGGMEAMDQIREMVLDVYNLKNDRQMVKMLQQDAQEQNLGTFENARGQNVELIITRAQARKRIMEIMDPTLADTIYNIEGMAWTEEMVAAIRDFLTDADFEFMVRQLDWYQDYYQGVNEVYSEIYGVNLPYNPSYSPISRQGVNKVEDAGLGEFFKEMPFRASASSAGSLISRVSSTLPLAPRNDIEVLQSHVSEMEHFKAWAQKIRDLNSVFSNPDVRTAIRVNFGSNIDQHIQNFIQDFARGGAETAANIRGWDRIRSRYTRAVLAIKPTIFLKQLTSAVAYADSIPAVYWAKEFVRVDQIPEAVDTLMQSTLMQHRWRKGEIERDIKTAMNSAEFARLRVKPSFMNKLLWLVKLGDSGAIILGGYPIYKYHLSQGRSPEEALRIFESVTESTQQSADLSEQSSWQRGGSFAKLFTMFMSSPNQYFRKEFGAVRNLAAGRIDKAQFFKTVAIYHLLLPMFFQWVSDRFTWDKEEQLRAMILGPLNGIFIFGDGLDAIIRAALGMQDFGLGMPIWSIFKDFGKALRLLDPDELDTEDFIRALRGLAGGVGGATGIPLKQFVDLLIGFSDLLAGEFEEGIAELLGWSPYLAEKAAEED